MRSSNNTFNRSGRLGSRGGGGRRSESGPGCRRSVFVSRNKTDSTGFETVTFFPNSSLTC